jgi:hypothetical protein
VLLEMYPGNQPWMLFPSWSGTAEVNSRNFCGSIPPAMASTTINGIPDWLVPMILLAPAMLWMFFGVGLPWALALLPRRDWDWQKPTTLIAVAMALGPMLTTTGMFLIGTFGQFSARNVLGISALIAALGLVLATRNHDRSNAPSIAQPPMTAVNITLLLVVVIVIVLRFWNAAYWPYTTYDEFWVYGYNAKLFMLKGNIPQSIGYYPQMVPLTYTYSQLIWGSINDHAARVAVPYFALGSALIAYVLGERLFNRQVGLLTTAIWMLYPQHAAWNQFGDLEVPLTFYFTGVVALFVLGWQNQSGQRWRYFLLSGLLLGAALWTKPTAAALVESLALIVGVVALRESGLCARIRIHSPKLPLTAAPFVTMQRENFATRRLFQTLWASEALRYSLLTCIAAAPIGGMWYIRNVLYGHLPVVFPAGYWQMAAQRSGQELGWPLLVAGAGVVVIALQRSRVLLAFGGFALLASAGLPSAFGGRWPTHLELSQLILGAIPVSIYPTRLGLIEYLMVVLGALLLAWSAIPLWCKLPTRVQHTVLLVFAFILPYCVTWFWSYSYHYRLSFAIVPSLVVLLAALVDVIVRRVARNPLRVFAISVTALALSLPGLAATPTGLEAAATGALHNDHAKMAQGNAALIRLVDYLNDRRDPNRRPSKLDRPMRVEAPGELRLPFFFPLDDIRTARYPMTLDAIDDVDFFIDSSVGQRLYYENGRAYNQILSSLNRIDVLRRVFTIDDRNFRFSVYTVNNSGRFVAPGPNGPLKVKVGDFAWLAGYDLSTLQNYPGENVYLTFWWQALKPADLDYSVYIHLWNPREQKLAATWGGEPVYGAFSLWDRVVGEQFPIGYHTRLWQTGETIRDEWKLTLPKDIPPGVYEFRIGLYDSVSGRRLPITRDDAVMGEFIRLPDFTVP